MNKLTKDIRRKIAKLSKMIPAMHHKDKTELVQIHGSKLIANGVSQLKDGTAVDPDKYYVAPTQKPVNHRKTMEAIYQRQGEAGLTQYCFGVAQIAKAANDELLKK